MRTLDFESGDTLFKDSREGFWTPLSVTGAGTSGGKTSSNSQDGLSGGAIAGVVVGSVAFIVIVAAIIVVLIVRRRKLRSRASTTTTLVPGNSEKSGDRSLTELDSSAYRELEVPKKPYRNDPVEVDGSEEPKELPWQSRFSEMPDSTSLR